MSTKIVSSLAPIGAAIALVCSSLTGYQVLNEIGSMIRGNATIALPSGHVIGAIGWVLLGIGITAPTLARRKRSAMVCGLALFAMIAFGGAVILIAIGNWQLSVAFHGLATVETVDADSFLQDAGRAKLPLLVGWVFVLAGGVLVFAADVISDRPRNDRVTAMPGGVGLAIGLMATVAYLGAAVWSAISLRSLEGSLTASNIDATSVAMGVNGVIRSVFLALIVIAACACVSLFMVITAEAPADKTSDEKMDEHEPE